MWALIKPHLIYWVLIVVALIGFRSWLVEHDNRLLTAANNKVLETQVSTLQSSITQLEADKKQIQAAADSQVEAWKQAAKKVTTPQQAILAIPDVSQLPIHSRPSVDNPLQVSVDALPLYQELNQCRQDQVSLGACQALREKDAETLVAKDSIIKSKDTEIANLKQPQGFWKRFTGTIKQVGIGIGIGIALGHKF